MTEVTNRADGPRGFNTFVDGGVVHAVIAPGETKDIALVNRNDPMLKAMLDAHQIEMGPETEIDQKMKPTDDQKAKAAEALNDNPLVRQMQSDLAQREIEATRLQAENERMRADREDMQRRLTALEASAATPAAKGK